MNKGRNTALLVVIVVVIIGAFLWNYRNASWLAPLLGASAPLTQTESGKVSYQCDGGKNITATYYSGPASAAAATNEPPTPNGSVALVLSDGRSMTLPQTISGSGIRYANADSSLVFWSEGNTAFITEGAGSDAPQTFSNCIALSDISGQGSWNIFASSTLGFSIKYPPGYTLTAPYSYEALGPGKTIMGVKFTIPESVATGTNLARDSYVSVEQLPSDAANCTANLFLGSQVGSVMTMTDNGVTYSMASGSDAGAGNLYNETVYAIPGSSTCTAVRYFIHSNQIGNYPPGTVVAFDQNALTKQFDAIRESLVLSK